MLPEINRNKTHVLLSIVGPRGIKTISAAFYRSKRLVRQLISIIAAEVRGAACDRAGEGRERG